MKFAQQVSKQINNKTCQTNQQTVNKANLRGKVANP